MPLPSDPDPEPPRSAPVRSAKPASMGDVARTISRRTTDLLAISIVLAASLTFGSQILWWWQTEAPPTGPTVHPSLAPPGWEDDLQPVGLEFGNLPLALTRQNVNGDRQAAIAALVRHCRTAVERSTAPLPTVDDAETRVFEQIAGKAPVAEQPGNWQIYVVDESFPLVVGVSVAGPASDHPAGRLLCYGLAMPAGGTLWTILLVEQGHDTSASPEQAAQVSLPPGAERTLSLRDKQGSLLCGFSENTTPEAWVRYFEAQAARRGWTRTEDWMQGADSWGVRYSRNENEGGWVDFRFARDRRGELTGIVQVLPQTREQTESRP